MIGETVGNFRLISRLGRGGMGEVYLAEQQSIGTRVAVKLLQAAISEDKDHVQRFFNEARAVSRIQHAGIVKIFDVGFHPQTGQAYLIMEYLEGESLGRRIRRSPLGFAEVADVGRQIASVLEATHAAGITHRDLKPDNIYLVPDRELASKERVKILDFGIAKLSGTLGASSPRTVGTLGTPAYMAPEQWGDSSKVDWRADVYALGCVTFEMVCGRPPFEAKTFAEACAQHLAMPPPALASIVTDAPGALDALLARLLAKDPAERPQSMHDIAAAFEAIGKDPAIAVPRAAITNRPRGDGETLATTSGEGTADTAVQLVEPTPSPTPPAPPPPLATLSSRRRAPVWLVPIVLVVLVASGVAARYVLRDNNPDTPPDSAIVVANIPIDAIELDAPSIDAAIDIDAGVSQQTLDHAVEVFLKNRDRLIACYTKHRLRAGRIEITIDVNAAGVVKDVGLAGADPKAERCVHDTTNALAFGKATAGFQKTYVLEFDLPPAVAIVPRPAPIPDPIRPPPGPHFDVVKLKYLQDAVRRIRATGTLENCQNNGAPRVQMTLEINAKGRAINVTVGSNASPTTQMCVRTIVMSIPFAPVPAILKPPLTIPSQYVFSRKPSQQGIVIPPPGE